MTREKLPEIRIPRIMIAAPSSGSGKTLFACALLRLLQRKGIRAASFKCGPDFIDPMFHRKVLGTPSRNLDLYLAGEEGVRRTLATGFLRAGAEIAVIEGVMGYYDGTGASGMEGSSYSIACATKTPVILVADARGMSRSAAALVKGFAEYGEQKLIRGAFLNRVSPAMSDMIGGWLSEETGIPVLGSFPLDEALHIDSRHLGLVEPGEIPDLMARIDHAADLLENTLNPEKLLDTARSAPAQEVAEEVPGHGSAAARGEENPVTIAVAEDEAFSFYYEDNLDLLGEMGAEIVRFSPLHDKRIPEADGLLLGGGYPELKAGELASNAGMMASIRGAAEGGMPILAECGGFQYLLEELAGLDGSTHKMCGVLKGKSAMTGKLVRFGYVEVSGEGQYFGTGCSIRGHEFHYSDSTNNGSACRAVKPGGRAWDCMVLQGRIAAGYPHLYYRSAPAFAEAFVRECRKFKGEKKQILRGALPVHRASIPTNRKEEY